MRKGFTIALTIFIATAVKAQYVVCETEGVAAVAAIFKKTFILTQDEAAKLNDAASIVVNSIGYHDLYVNGACVNEYKPMQPAVTQLDKRTLMVSYDRGFILHEGKNVIEIHVGQGWGRIYGMPAAVKVLLYHQEGNDRQLILKTDSTWLCSPDRYTYTGSWEPLQFGGVRIDGRWEAMWRNATAKKFDWIKESEQEFYGNHIIGKQDIVAREVEKEGCVVLDFGKSITGWLQVDFARLDKDDEITLEYMDHRDAAAPHTESDTYIARGERRESFLNHYMLHSFRYVRVSGKNTGDITNHIDKAQAIQISGVPIWESSTFECSDERLNAVHDMIRHTLSCLTFSGYMVDCPHLERMGYGGDGNSSTMTLQTMYDVEDTYRNWLTAWSDAMDSTGSLPYVAPRYPTGGGPYWSGFIIKAPWRSYVNYGDQTLIDRHYGEMKRWLEYVERYSTEGLLSPWPDEGRMWFLGDWLAPKGVDVGGESALFVSNCFVSECLSDMVKMARLQGLEAEALEYEKRRKHLVEAIHKAYYHKASKSYANGTVLDMTYALLAEIAPTEEIRQETKRKLLEDCHEKHKDHIAVGLMGVPIFTEWVIKEKECDLMCNILRQEDYPGYLYMINNGATTTWESWDGERSRIHNCYNGVGIWFYQALAGIRPDEKEPGYKHFFIDPQRCSGIDWVKATKKTRHGEIQVYIEGSKLMVTIPEGTTATIFPGSKAERPLGAGRWTLAIPEKHSKNNP
ncbi:MAG: glycoside hydrolase family 78 protein [Bacteroidales bacterium]|nr:glycoside hydrolase family 78 protein [Bacteroidales bacterium]